MSSTRLGDREMEMGAERYMQHDVPQVEATTDSMSLVRWPQVPEAIWMQFSPWIRNALEEWDRSCSRVVGSGVEGCVHRRATNIFVSYVD